MRGTQQIWNSVWQEGPYDNHTAPQDQPAPPEGFGIVRLGAAALRAPAASKVDYRPQAILKLHRPSSLDYRVPHELPVSISIFTPPFHQPCPWKSQKNFNFYPPPTSPSGLAIKIKKILLWFFILHLSLFNFNPEYYLNKLTGLYFGMLDAIWFLSR